MKIVLLFPSQISSNVHKVPGETMVIGLRYRSMSIKHPLQECKIFVSENVSVYFLFHMCTNNAQTEISILIPSQIIFLLVSVTLERDLSLCSAS